MAENIDKGLAAQVPTHQLDANHLDAAGEAQADAHMTDEERRNDSRNRQFKGAKIVFNDGFGSYDCLIRNLSHDGAKLSFAAQTAVPHLVELVVEVDGLTYECEVIWQTAREVGVRFLSEPKVTGTKRDLKEIFVK